MHEHIVRVSKRVKMLKKKKKKKMSPVVERLWCVCERERDGERETEKGFERESSLNESHRYATDLQVQTTRSLSRKPFGVDYELLYLSKEVFIFFACVVTYTKKQVMQRVVIQIAR